MKTLLKVGLLVLCLFIFPVYAKELPPPPQIIAQVDTSSREWIKERISYYASLYRVSEITMNIAVKCESQFHPNAVGDNGNSFGLVQIYLPAHPQISKEEAMDVDFALDCLGWPVQRGRRGLARRSVQLDSRRAANQ